MKNLLHAAILAVQFLTRIPVPVSVEPEESTTGKALVLFPLVGWLLGSLLFALWWLLNASGKFNPFTASVIIVTAETILTGAFHLDGLADTFDALLSPGTSPEEKLSIMKDSRIGVMGATALILSLLLKAALLSELLEINMALAIVMYPVAGRWNQVALYVLSPYVRQSGVGKQFSIMADRKTLLLASIWLLPYFAFPVFIFSFLFLILFTFGYRKYVHGHIGGITGDILGSATVLSEIFFLLGVVIFNL